MYRMHYTLYFIALFMLRYLQPVNIEAYFCQAAIQFYSSFIITSERDCRLTLIRMIAPHLEGPCSVSDQMLCLYQQQALMNCCVINLSFTHSVEKKLKIEKLVFMYDRSRNSVMVQLFSEYIWV